MFVFELCRTRVSENSGSPIEVQTNSVAMPKQITNIHDAFFKRALSDPSLASTFLREHLPPDLAGLLGPEAPEPVSGSFVDEALREHLSDLLFRIQLKGSRDGLAYILMEHKSSPDPGARLQLLRYVVRVLTQSYEQNNRQLPLPPGAALAGSPGAARVDDLVRVRGLVRHSADGIACLLALLPPCVGRPGSHGGEPIVR
jgi:hypothetical protein